MDYLIVIHAWLESLRLVGNYENSLTYAVVATVDVFLPVYVVYRVCHDQIWK